MTTRSLIAVIAIAFFALCAVASAGGARRIISTARVSIQIPAGWQAQVSKTPACDPERLIVASSTRMLIRPDGQLPSPRAGTLLIVLLEDRYRQDRPVGDLRRPQHFSVSWNRLARIKPSCGLPSSPGYVRYVRTHGRYLGFIVYPGAATRPRTREATVTLMDSLRVNP